MRAQAKQISNDSVRSSHVTRAYMEQKIWLGLGEALEWIALRETTIAERDYAERDGSATHALIRVLSDTEPSIAERVIEGVLVNDGSSEHGGIPHGVWPQTVPAEEYESGHFALSPIDDNSEYGGSLIGQLRTWTNLRIRSFFILDLWKAGILEIDPALQGSDQADSLVDKLDHVAPSEVRLFLKSTLAQIPCDLTPLTQAEVVGICRAKFPTFSRERTEALFKEERPKTWPTKRGPRGPRNPGRKAKLEEFTGQITSGKLSI